MLLEKDKVKNGPMTTERIRGLKERLRKTMPSICIDRARLVTQAYGRFFNETPVLLKAKVTGYVLDNMKIRIDDDELIVGNHGSRYRSAPIFPEYGASWIMDEIDTFRTRGTDPLDISDDDRKELLDILESWKGKGFAELAGSKLPKETLEAEKAGIMTVGCRITSTGHVVPNYDKLLRIGFKGIIDEAMIEKAKITEFNDANQRKIDFLDAVIISAHAVIRFAERYSVLAEEMAQKESGRRREELLTIADICKRVPANPPQGFQEALQFFWFVHLTIQIETNGHSIGLGRFDQHMYPYYRKDIEDGLISRDEAIELIQYTWLKLTELLKVRDSFNSQAFAGYPIWQNMAIGGVTREGKDAVNDLSFAVLDAFDGVQTVQPSCSFRYHDNIDPDFFKKALELTQKGLAMPAYYNDKLVVPMLLQKGATIEDARDWSIEGCVEPFVTGKSDGRPNVGYVNGIKLVELILNNGLDPVTGKEIGVRTGEIDTFKSLEDLMKALELQLKHFVKLMLEGFNNVTSLHAVRMPAPLASLTVDDCIKKGMSLQEGGAIYNYSSAFITALANTVDALAAIDQIVFKEKKLSLKELNEILKKNFEGNERIRQLLLNGAPKYGNDIDSVDKLANDIVQMYVRELDNYEDSRGGKYILSILSSSFNVLQGKSVGATADGRRAFEALADNGSPYAGRDVNGPTATIKSLSKIDQINVMAGTLLNLKFDSNIVKGEKGLEVLGNLIESYFKLMGEHVQINVASVEELREAQRNPQKYSNLMVRVAGYSAYFTELDVDVQENIIARTTHKE